MTSRLLSRSTSGGHQDNLQPAYRDTLRISDNLLETEDEGKIPHDDMAIGYDWITGPSIK